MAGRHAAGQTTRRAPLTREDQRTETQRTVAAKRGRKPPPAEYRARHALHKRAHPIAPFATAAAVTVAVVGAAVGLSQAATPHVTKAADQTPVEPSGSPAVRQTAEPASRATRPSPKPSPTAKKTRTVVIGTCQASFYDEPQGTASGERFNPEALTAAHKTWKMGTRVRVTNPRNGKSVIVRINDRGPYVSGRCIDLSKAAFAAIEDLGRGVMSVRYEVLA